MGLIYSFCCQGFSQNGRLFLPFKKIQTCKALLYLYKSQIRPKMEYCSHIWAGSSQQALSTIDRVQKRMRGLVGDELFSSLQPLSLRSNVASLSLFYRYFHGKCSDELHSLVPPIREFSRNTRFAKSTTSHPYFLQLPFTRCVFHSNNFFPRTAAMWSVSEECFPAEYNLDLFKSKVNKFLSPS